MSQSNDAPREWWFYFDVAHTPHIHHTELSAEQITFYKYHSHTHVIEASAYAKLKAERDELRAKLDVARAALSAAQQTVDWTAYDERFEAGKLVSEALEKLK